MTLLLRWAYNRLVHAKRRGVDATYPRHGTTETRSVMHSYANTLLTLVSSHLPGAGDRKAISRRVATIAPPTLQDEQRAAVHEAEAMLKAGVR